MKVRKLRRNIVETIQLILLLFLLVYTPGQGGFLLIKIAVKTQLWWVGLPCMILGLVFLVWACAITFIWIMSILDEFK